MLKRLVGFLILIFMALSSAVIFPFCLLIWLLTVFFDRRLRLLHQVTCYWGALYVWLFPFWSLRVENRHKFKNNKCYLIVSNHQSQLDILICFSLRKHFKWVSKAEVFLVPFIGWNMYLNRYIRLRRGQLNSVRKMYQDCIDTLAGGSSVFIFPEGTRSQEALPGDFKPGAFSIAKRAKVPILPIAISGTREALPKNSLQIQGRTRMQLTVLDEIPLEVVEQHDAQTLAKMARQQIIDALSSADVK